MKFYFRIDLSNKFGLGHYFRVKSFISITKIKKYKIVVDKIPSTDFFNLEKNNFLQLYKSGLRFKSEKLDAEQFLKVTKCNSRDTVVIKDSYRLAYEWEKKISKKCRKIIAIEDFINKKHYVDFYINYSPAFLIRKKKDLDTLKLKNKKNCKLLLGPNFALFNTKIKKREKIISDIAFYNGGSGDPLVYQKIIKKLIKLNYKIVIIIGPLVKKNKYQKVINKFEKFKNVEIINKPFGIINILKGTKLFVSSAGISMLESSFFKIPTLLFKMISNQNLKDENYEKLGHYFILEKKDINSTDKIIELINLMVTNVEKIKFLMKNNSLNLIKIKKNYKTLLKF